MPSGAPDQARWIREEPRRSLPAAVIERIARAAFPGSRVVETEPLTDGRRNLNLKVLLDAMPEWIVLRVYEQDASLCRKELDLFRLLAGSVPVPQVIHAEPDGLEDLPPFTLTRYVEGISYRELRRSGDAEAVAQAAYSAGETLAAIGRVRFPQAGWLGPGPTVGAPLLEGDDSLPRFVDSCLESANLRQRMPADVCEGVHASVWSRAAELAELDGDARLVHGDFNKRNLLVRQSGGRWSVAAILDWEFAISGSALVDFGNFLRYERSSRPPAEPHFSAGFLSQGGELPPDWRRLSRLVDLAAVCEILTHGVLPDPIAAEVVELIRATVESREPRLGDN